MKEGKQPPTLEERQKEEKKARDEDFKKKMEEFERKNKENQDKFDEFVQKSESINKQIQKEREKIESSHNGLRDKILLGAMVFLWISMVVYTNYSNAFGPKVSSQSTKEESKLREQ